MCTGVSRAFPLALLCLALLGALTAAHAQSTTETAAAAKPNRDIVKATNSFGFRMLGKLCDDYDGSNVCISPTSLSYALGMLYLGARGTTAEAMAKGLGWQAFAMHDLNWSNAALLSSLNGAEGVTLRVADSVWVDDGGSGIRPEFVQQARDFYQAEAREITFADEQAGATVNTWVAEKTAGKIRDLLSPGKLDNANGMVLVNAVYFNGKWQTPFDKALTKEGDFTLPSGEKKRLPMMTRSGQIRYCRQGDIQAVCLPYSADGRVCMYLFLPSPTTELAGVDTNWESWMQQFRRFDIRLTIPRFRLSFKQDMERELTSLGMGQIFADNSDFTGLSERDLTVDRVVHQTVLEVDEEGTEAAAATAVVVGTLSDGNRKPIDVVFDRPFFCAIRDTQTGAILFMAYVVNPE